MRTLVLAILASGCGWPDPGPSCDRVADHVLSLMAPVDDQGREVVAAIRARCTADRWPEAVRYCLTSTESLAKPNQCKAKLDEAQRTKLDAELLAAQRRTLPEACTRYEHAVDQLAGCEAVPRQVRDELRSNLASARAMWSNRQDKRELHAICASALRAVKVAAIDCAGSEQW